MQISGVSCVLRGVPIQSSRTWSPTTGAPRREAFPQVSEWIVVPQGGVGGPGGADSSDAMRSLKPDIR